MSTIWFNFNLSSIFEMASLCHNLCVCGQWTVITCVRNTIFNAGLFYMTHTVKKENWTDFEFQLKLKSSPLKWTRCTTNDEPKLSLLSVARCSRCYALIELYWPKYDVRGYYSWKPLHRLGSMGHWIFVFSLN